MWRKTRITVLALALVMALAPAAPRAQAAEEEGSTVKKAIAYVGCAGSIALLPFTVVGVFAMAIACANAMAISVE
jgi:hypothetical protein